MSQFGKGNHIITLEKKLANLCKKNNNIQAKDDSIILYFSIFTDKFEL